MAADAVAGETESAEFGILGPLEVLRSGRVVPLGGPRQRAVLALLLLEANRVGVDGPAGRGRLGRGPARGVGHDLADVRVPPAPGAGAGPGPGRRAEASW